MTSSSSSSRSSTNWGSLQTFPNLFIDTILSNISDADDNLFFSPCDIYYEGDVSNPTNDEVCKLFANELSFQFNNSGRGSTQLQLSQTQRYMNPPNRDSCIYPSNSPTYLIIPNLQNNFSQRMPSQHMINRSTASHESYPKDVQHRIQIDERNCNLIGRNPAKKKKVQASYEIKDEACGICLDSVKRIGKMDCCTHVFCLRCINTWSKRNKVCPLCRKSFSSIKTINKFVVKKD